MATQFISTNKNYKRLYNAPLDPSLVWDDINELREYLKDPTCYLNMIVGCSGKAYIIVEKNGVKDLEPIGTVNSDGTINSNLYVGSEEPTDDEIIAWIDTSDIEEGYTSNISDLIINEFREIFKTMNEEIAKLKDRVLYLETHGVNVNINKGILIDENEDILTFEDGSIMCFENTPLDSEVEEPTTNNIVPVYGDNIILTTEDGKIIIY